MPSRPPTSARSVPWPEPVSAKEPYRWMAAFTGGAPSSVRAMAPIRAAPAVWELEGPIITGPSMSKMSSIAGTPFRVSSQLLYHIMRRGTMALWVVVGTSD